MADGKKKQKHIVVFQDDEGNVIKTSFVSHGEAADLPEMPAKKGDLGHYEILFQGWDHDTSSICSNLVVKACYEKVPKKYLVMYFNENGSILGTEFVPYGSPAKAELSPEKENNAEFLYRFTGWDEDLSRISKDTKTKPRFSRIRRSYPVRFLDDDGSLLRETAVLYGRAALPPSDPEKASDPVYDYAFAGWDASFDFIDKATDVHALYDSIYKEYSVKIYEEDKLISETSCHYNDPIEYPPISRKGYTLTWTPEPKSVSGDIEIRGTYTFTNHTGKEIEQDGNRYRILNPSTEAGTVILLDYRSDEKKISLSDTVRLGDYYYRISEIDSKAFAGCLSMEILDLPDSISVLREEAVAGCRSLREIRIGKGLRRIDKHAFSENTHLKKIMIRSDSVRNVHRSAFERMDTPVTLYLKPNIYHKRYALLEKAMGSGSVWAQML